MSSAELEVRRNPVATEATVGPNQGSHANTLAAKHILPRGQLGSALSRSADCKARRKLRCAPVRHEVKTSESEVLVRPVSK